MVLKSRGSSSRSAQRSKSRRGRAERHTGPAKTAFRTRHPGTGARSSTAVLSLCSRPRAAMMRAVSSSAKCRPVPGAPLSRITLRATGASVPRTKGRRMARTTPSTKASCPSTVFFDLGRQPFKAAQMLRLRVGGAFGQQAVILHVPQHLTAVFQRRLGVGILLFQLGILLFQQLVQLFLLLQKGRVQVRQAPGLCLLCPAAQLRNQISRARLRRIRRS